MKRLLTEYVGPTLLVFTLFVCVKAYLHLHGIVLLKPHHNHAPFTHAKYTR
ncbi:hypothetical protein [Spirosoma sp. KCTC 42546]|uniref:hypothetical protein n=1 Tax=Spirosoma sp. KCTC 42546 TaxID=2520506 RepID=UPI00143DF093|nr:hypothetical protein [Spirosoma sp. KCTC 42546]